LHIYHKFRLLQGLFGLPDFLLIVRQFLLEHFTLWCYGFRLSVGCDHQLRLTKLTLKACLKTTFFGVFKILVAVTLGFRAYVSLLCVDMIMIKSAVVVQFVVSDFLYQPSS